MITNGGDEQDKKSEVFVSVAEACRVSTLSKSTIHRLIAEQRLDSVLIRRRRIIRLSSLNQLLTGIENE